MKKLSLCIFTTLFAFQIPSITNASETNNNSVNTEVIEGLTDNTLSLQDIEFGALKSQFLYFTCITETAERLKSMYPDSSQIEILSTINDSCTYSEDLFSIYNIVLAHQAMKKEVSEKDALNYLEKAYKEKGREKANNKQRLKIFKTLNLIE